jgi:hypothetical protein
MNKKLILILLVYGLSSIYGLLVSFEIIGYWLYIILVLSLGILFRFLYLKYKPNKSDVGMYTTFFTLEGRIIDQSDILATYEITPIEKLLFATKSPKNNFSSSYNNKGLIVRTVQESFLIDCMDADFLEVKKRRKVKHSNIYVFLYYIFLLLPLAVLLLFNYFNIDPIIWAGICFVFIFIVVARIMPPFFLGKRVDVKGLPLYDKERDEFKGITVIEGFVFSDRLSVIPFRKAAKLDGLAINLLFKKYIILNPRIYYVDSIDLNYARFVIFHELGHIKHRDGLDAFIVVISLLVLDLVLTMLPYDILHFMPYLEYIILAFAVIFLLISVMRRKKVEKRADAFALKCIGEQAADKIYERYGIR